MDIKLLDILSCPQCKGPLAYHAQKNTLTCQKDRLIFPIRDNIPILLVEEAQPLTKRKSDADII